MLAGPTSAISRRSRVAGQDARPASWLHARKARGVLLGGLILIGVGVAIGAGVIQRPPHIAVNGQLQSITRRRFMSAWPWHVIRSV